MSKKFDRGYTAEQRMMLDYIKPGCYVETAPDASGDIQGGTVTKVIRDMYKVPVCIQVSNGTSPSGRKKYDYISVERITFFEPYDEYCSPMEYYGSFEEIDADFQRMGYHYVEEKGCWVNPETGDETCY